jgi:hypothetical protein
MKVVLAFLADHAVAHDDGKVYVIGGGVDRLQFKEFPATHPSLALVVKLAFQRAEFGRPLAISLRGVATDGTPIAPVRRITILPQATPSMVGDTVPFPFVHNMHDLVFPNEGLYMFEILANDVELANVELAVVTAPNPEAMRQISQMLSDGYATFRKGDHAAAESLFREVIRRAPDTATAHNDLGFTCLARGDGVTATQEFEEARRLGFSIAEVVTANTASCAYLRGDFSAAANDFSDAMRLPFTSGGMILMLIQEKAMTPILLAGSGDYTGLMALNAAWSYARDGDRTRAEVFAAAAQAPLLTLPEDSADREAFATSLSQLRAILGAPAPTQDVSTSTP